MPNEISAQIIIVYFSIIFWCYCHESHILKAQFVLMEYKILLKLQCMCYDEFFPPEGSAIQTQRAQSAPKNQTLSNFILFQW